MFKRHIKLLAALILVAGSVNIFAGGTVRNSAEDGDARRRALQAWNQEGTKSAAKRATAKLKKNSVLIDRAAQNEENKKAKRAAKVAAQVVLAADLAAQN
ncbi:MAG: hypothetical protein Q8Q60_01430 [Candidatus Chromulinivorax sp.]|nr:hypothetical protein [Candidatus Chromulinivorax sp.]